VKAVRACLPSQSRIYTHHFILLPCHLKRLLDLICWFSSTELKLATGPYKAARDAYVAATATYTKSLYE